MRGGTEGRRSGVVPWSVIHLGRRYNGGHPLKAHTGGEHRNNFGVFCQFGGKENNSNEYEQRTEQIGEIGDKVHVVFKDNFIPWSFMLH